jgi:hypothetical protein
VWTIIRVHVSYILMSCHHMKKQRTVDELLALREFSEQDIEELRAKLQSLRPDVAIHPITGVRRSLFRRGIGTDRRTIFVSQRLAHDWVAEYKLRVRDGRLVVRELVIFPRADTSPEKSLSSRVLRQLRIGYCVQSLATAVAEVQKEDPSALAPDGYLGRAGLTPEVVAVPSPRAQLGGRGRPALPDSLYLQLAADYVTVLARGSTKPVQELAASRGLPVGRVRSQLQRARQLGFLDPGVQGSAGGQLTPRAKRLLTKRRKGSSHAKTARTR